MKGIIFGHLNINRIYNKIPDINYLLNKLDIDIFSICETWLTDTIKNSELFIDSKFNIFRLDRSFKCGGGLLVLVNKKIEAEVQNSLILPEIELLHLTLNIKCSKSIDIVNVHRPPGSSFSIFIDLLSNFLRNVNYHDPYFLILGDMNINILNKASRATHLLSRLV